MIWAILLTLAAIGLLLLLGGDLPLRFTYPPLNNLAYIVFLLAIPATFFRLVFATSHLWAKVLGALLGVITLVPTGCVSMFAGFDMVAAAVEGKDTSFEPIGELKDNWTTYRVYRTNGGATTSFGIVLRKEVPVFPGLRYVRVVHSRYHASEAILKRTGDRTGELSIEAYGQEYPAETFSFEL